VQTWELHPLPRHQYAVDAIRATLQKYPADGAARCDCVSVADTYIRFPDGSLKRPDIAIYCERPPEMDSAIEVVPEAVVEVISPGFEQKDLVLNPPFYLAQGVKDVLVFDPATLKIVHFALQGKTEPVAPVQVNLQCGCSCSFQ
jgi:Uma2 family endonuclease